MGLLDGVFGYPLVQITEENEDCILIQFNEEPPKDFVEQLDELKKVHKGKWTGLKNLKLRVKVPAHVQIFLLAENVSKEIEKEYGGVKRKIESKIVNSFLPLSNQEECVLEKNDSPVTTNLSDEDDDQENNYLDPEFDEEDEDEIEEELPM